MKKNKYLLCVACLLIFDFSLFGQNTFQKTYGGSDSELGYAVQQTSDGGYIITGNTMTFGVVPWNCCSGDVYLIKTDSNGDTLWTKTFGGSDYDAGFSVQQTNDGGYIIGGFAVSFGSSESSCYLIKTDSNGDSLWTKTFGLIGEEKAYSVQQTNDGGYMIAGNTYNSVDQYANIYFIKTDVNGDSLWTKFYGGSNYYYCYSAQQTNDDGYIFAGSADGSLYLLKTDSLGNIVWSKTFGGLYGRAYSVQQTSDAGYIIAGKTSNFGAGNFDVYLIKVDSMGTVLWSRTFGGSDIDIAYSVQQTIDGGYIIAGETSSFGAGGSDIYLIKTEITGDPLWTKTFGGTDQERISASVKQTTDGGYIIAGTTRSFGAGSEDIYLIKTDSMGNSNCNEGNTATIVTWPVTQVGNPITIISSLNTIITSPATVLGNGSTVTSLCSTVGIEIVPSNSQGALSISPNPTSNNFSIIFPNYIKKGMIEICTVLGQKIFVEHISNASQKEIYLKNISSGIYFTRVFDGEKSYCKKLIVE